jgi:3-methyladenine DNA glycosylase AlkC
MEPFKNKISAELVAVTGYHLDRHLSVFDRSSYEAAILSKLDALELKERAQLIADETHKVLPAALGERYRILAAMLYPEEGVGIDAPSDERGIRGWGLMPLTRIVGEHGLEDFEASLALLKEMTKRATSEFDVRPFLNADQDRALKIMAPWVGDESVHVRRLVSEGTRPRLPWGMQLKKLIADPAPTLPLLEALKDDPEEYVRRSVANHLNDIAKDHPDLVAGLAADWLKDAAKNREKLVRHACRTLIKQGHSGALEAFGLGPPEISLASFAVRTPVVDHGSSLAFDVEIKSVSGKSQSLVIDYVVHFRKANGTLAPKVFKWTSATLEPGQTLALARKHPIRPITTRVYYPGEQLVSLRINGQDFGCVSFELNMT